MKNLRILSIALLLLISAATRAQDTKNFSCGLFELKYPSNWQTKEINSWHEETLFSMEVKNMPNTMDDAGVGIAIDTLPAMGKTVDSMQKEFSAMQKQDAAKDMFIEGAKCEVGGLKGFAIVMNVPFQKNSKGKIITLLKGNKAIMISFMASGGRYQEYLPQFEKILASLKFK